jgi:hypothetical protein
MSWLKLALPSTELSASGRTMSKLSDRLVQAHVTQRSIGLVLHVFSVTALPRVSRFGHYLVVAYGHARYWRPFTELPQRLQLLEAYLIQAQERNRARSHGSSSRLQKFDIGPRPVGRQATAEFLGPMQCIPPHTCISCSVYLLDH